MPGGYNALMAYPPRDAEEVNALFNQRPGYVNQSDGSVGIVGKAIGSLGLDLEGRRAATSWEDAWHNSVDPDTTGRRANLFPITSDGGYAVPGMAAIPFEGFDNAWARGDLANIANPEALTASSLDSLDAAGGAMTGGLAAGMVGAVPEGAVAANGIGARIRGLFSGYEPKPYESPPTQSLSMSLSDTPALGPGALHFSQEVPRSVRAASGEPFSARAYRGQGEDIADFTGRDHFDRNGFWASNNPVEASSYAGGTGSVAPVDVSFQNPHVYDAKGRNWDRLSDGDHTTDIVSRVKQENPYADGLIFNDVGENVGPSVSFVALKPGTVRSATTGQLLYSNSPTGSSVPLAFNDYQDQPQNALMPSLSKKEKDHHSLTQPRTASGQFTR